MFFFRHRGNFNKTERFFEKNKNSGYVNILSKYGQEGVNALQAATPLDSGKTASSWTYEIEQNGTSAKIVWINTNVNGNVNIALILQYGHGTGTGGYVQGIDYINPAMKTVFDRIAEEAWKEVTGA